MPEHWRSQAARSLVRKIRAAGGTVERTRTGMLRITGPKGVITIKEPGKEVRKDMQREQAGRKITGATGLELGR